MTKTAIKQYLASLESSTDPALRLAVLNDVDTREAIVVVDSENTILAVNEEFSHITGYTQAEIIGTSICALRSGQRDSSLYDRIYESMRNTGKWTGELWHKSKSGRRYPAWVEINSIHDANNNVICRVSKFRDITSAKHAAEVTFYQDNHDLTVPGATQARNQLHGELVEAINKKQFVLYFQPIVDLKTQKICRAEVLVRWNHPVKGLLSPIKFIPFAEVNELIVPIGDWVFQQTVFCAKHFMNIVPNGIQLSFNVSPAQFTDGSFKMCGDWTDYVDKMNVPYDKLCIEVTEGLLVSNNEFAVDILTIFRLKGMSVALDDFGTGYSALYYLKKFKVDTIKVDRTFVQDIVKSHKDQAIVNTVIHLAKSLGITVVAEGIETLEQHKLLTNMQCDYGQGFMYSRPVPIEEFEKLLLLNHQSVNIVQRKTDNN